MQWQRHCISLSNKDGNKKSEVETVRPYLYGGNKQKTIVLYMATRSFVPQLTIPR